MNLINRKPQQTPAEEPAATQPYPGPFAEQFAAMQILADNHDEAERAADCFEQAEALRATITGSVESAEAEVGRVQAEAARMLDEARRNLAAAQVHAKGVESEAAAVEDTGRAFRAAANLAAQADEARQQAATLAAERQDQLAAADALSRRLSDLAGLQRAAQADLEAARQATDADAAGEARQRLTGLEEVVPVLAGQRDQALARARAIGTEDSGGEFAKVLARITALTAQRETALDNARPERREARYAANPGLRLTEMFRDHPELVGEWTGKIGDQGGKTPTTVRRDAAGHTTIRTGH